MLPLGRGFFAVAALLTATGAVQAADLRISPTRLGFTAQQTVQTLTLSNPGATPVLVETAAFDWATSPKSLKATRDLIVSPPIVEVPPQGQVQLRIGFRPSSPPQGVCELSYRLWVTEVLRAQQAQAPLRLRTRISLPVFRQVGVGCKPELTWSWSPGQVELSNQGNGHAQLQELLLVDHRQQWRLQAPPLGYLLPGEQWQLRLPEDWRPDAQGKPVLRAQSRQGAVEAQLITAP
nr:molecular chaperone [Oceanococcus sp. HetDA_MAG_MS8]